MTQKTNPNQFFEEPQLSLAKSISNNNISALKEGLQNTMQDEVNEPGNKGVTLLYWAVLHANLEATKSLIDSGADPNQWIIDEEEKTHLVAISARAKSDDVLQLLLDKGGDPNGTYNGTFATFHAILIDKPERLKMLLKAGADIDAFDEIYKTSLVHYCGMLEDFKTVVYLLERNAKHDVESASKGNLAFEVQAAEDTLDEENEKFRLMAQNILKDLGVEFPVPHPAK